MRFRPAFSFDSYLPNCFFKLKKTVIFKSQAPGFPTVNKLE